MRYRDTKDASLRTRYTQQKRLHAEGANGLQTFSAKSSGTGSELILAISTSPLRPFLEQQQVVSTTAP